MAKRFVDTELWQKEWFQDLDVVNKLFLKYIFENCDCAGVWNSNYRLASFILGHPYSIENIKTINDKKEQFEILDNGNIFVIDFIKFQYGTLSENCKPHKPVIEKLKKYKLFERVSKGYSKGFKTLEEKEQEQEQYKEKEKEYSVYGKYLNVCLGAEQYNHLLGICASQKLLDELIDSLSEKIEEGKEKPFMADYPNAHYIRIQKYREFRLKYPDKFRTEQKKSAVAETTDKWYEEMKARGYGS